MSWSKSENAGSVTFDGDIAEKMDINLVQPKFTKKQNWSALRLRQYFIDVDGCCFYSDSEINTKIEQLFHDSDSLLLPVFKERSREWMEEHTELVQQQKKGKKRKKRKNKDKAEEEEEERLATVTAVDA